MQWTCGTLNFLMNEQKWQVLCVGCQIFAQLGLVGYWTLSIILYSKRRTKSGYLRPFLSLSERVSRQVNSPVWPNWVVAIGGQKQIQFPKCRVLFVWGNEQRPKPGTSKGRFTHSMPCPCRFPAMPCVNSHMPCHAMPLPCSDSAVSFMKVRVVVGNIRTACPTV
jgi:hypothetical protein